MFARLHTRTLWIIATVSGFSFLLSPILSLSIQDYADKILLERFEAAWMDSHAPSLVWNSISLAEQISLAATILIAVIALSLCTYAAWTLYKRRV